MSDKYRIDDGIVYVDDEAVATYEDGVVTSDEKLAPAHKAGINRVLEAMDQEKATFEVGNEEPEEVPARDIPPQPALDKQLGSKTPENLRWLREYHPEEYAKMKAELTLPPH